MSDSDTKEETTKISTPTHSRCNNDAYIFVTPPRINSSIVYSSNSPLNKLKQQQILQTIHKKIKNRQRKSFTPQELHNLRHVYRCSPSNMNIDEELFEILFHSQLNGYSINICNSYHRQKEQRIKQISVGKHTIGYLNYIRLIPWQERIPNVHPCTPKYNEMDESEELLCKRRFSGKMNKWRKALHMFDDIRSVSNLPWHLLTEHQKNDRLQQKRQRHKKHKNSGKYKQQWLEKKVVVESNTDVKIDVEIVENVECVETDDGSVCKGGKFWVKKNELVSEEKDIQRVNVKENEDSENDSLLKERMKEEVKDIMINGI